MGQSLCRSWAAGNFICWIVKPAPNLGRQEALELVNRREGCCGFLTKKRALENYIHDCAISLAGGGHIEVDDYRCVGSILARHWYEKIPQALGWEALSGRARRRLIYRAKCWLNRQAVDQMTGHVVRRRSSR